MSDFKKVKLHNKFLHPLFRHHQCLRLTDIYQMKIFVCIGVDIGFCTDGQVEVDDGEFAGPLFHIVEYLGRQYMNAAECILVVLFRIKIRIKRFDFSCLMIMPTT